MYLTGRKIVGGKARGQILKTRMGISFFGGVDPDTGLIVEQGHELEGQSIKDKILVFPSGKGSTVGSYTLYRLKHNGCAPAGIINSECETITAVGCIIAEIPCIDRIDLKQIPSNASVSLDADMAHLQIVEE